MPYKEKRYGSAVKFNYIKTQREGIDKKIKTEIFNRSLKSVYIEGTVKEIASKVGVKPEDVERVFMDLISINRMKKIDPSLWMLNPDYFPTNENKEELKREYESFVDRS